jgi:hypothetical protein
MKPVEIVLRRRGGVRRRGRGRMTEGVNPTKIYYKHTCKHHNVFPVQLLYANKIIFKTCGVEAQIQRRRDTQHPEASPLPSQP